MSENVIVRNENTVEWNKSSELPGLRWKYLVDSTEAQSHGLSTGVLEIATGAELPLHHHSPQEIYLIRKGEGLLLKKDGETQPVRPDDVIYIPEGEQHGLRNTGDTPLEFLWIFPTDCWQEVAYIFAQEK